MRDRAREEKVFTAVEEYIERQGYSPSFREVAKEVSLSVDTTYRVLLLLRGQGRLTWMDGKARTLRVLND